MPWISKSVSNNEDMSDEYFNPEYQLETAEVTDKQIRKVLGELRYQAAKPVQVIDPPQLEMPEDPSFNVCLACE